MRPLPVHRCWLACPKGLLASLLLLGLWLPLSSLAADDNYPSATIKFIVPVEAGGGIDSVARAVAQHLGDRLKQNIVVNNRSGAGGMIGTALAASAPADGYNLLVTGGTHLSAAVLHPNPSYHPLKDFEPVARLAVSPYVLLVNKALNIHTVQELVTYSRANPGKLAYGSGASNLYIANNFFMHQAGVNWLFVPYKGSGPMVRALLANEIQVSFVSVGNVDAALKTGRVVALAVVHGDRLASLPQVPTLKEAGYPAMNITQWFGVFAPVGTPAPILDLLSRELLKMVDHGPFNDYLQANSMVRSPLDRKEFARILKKDHNELIELEKSGRIEKMNP